MIKIFTAASAQDKDFFSAFSGYLEHGFDATGFSRPSNAPALLLHEYSGAPEPADGKCIVVFKGGSEPRLPLPGPEQAVAVVDSSDEALLAFVSAARLPAIPCGLRTRDTVTLSSMDDESAVIDLRRAVTRFDGTTAEPQEIPVRLGCPPHKFALMAAAAVLLLTGGAQPPEGKK